VSIAQDVRKPELMNFMFERSLIYFGELLLSLWPFPGDDPVLNTSLFEVRNKLKNAPHEI